VKAVISRGWSDAAATIGLMQIKLSTARGLGYTGNAEGLPRIPTPNSDLCRAILGGRLPRCKRRPQPAPVAYYASGYYQAAKRQRLAHGRPADANAQVSRLVGRCKTGDARVDTPHHRPNIRPCFRGELR